MMNPVDALNAEQAAAAATAPPAIAPPPGIAGLFDDYDPTQLLDLSQFKPGQVFCNIYDLGDSDNLRLINAVSTANNKMLIGGLFHVGLEVFGAEWCYGFTEEDRSGVSRIFPRSHQQHTYRTTVPLGYTSKSPKEVQELTDRLAEEWRGNEYHLIHKNCQTFANALCPELGVRNIPGWVDRAARVASAVDHTSKAAREGAHQTVTLVRKVTSEVTEKVEHSVRSALPSDEVVQQFASEAAEVAEYVGENVRKGSITAFSKAQQTAAELAEAARVQAGMVQATAAATAAVAADFGAQAQGLLGEDLSVKAQQVGKETQQQARAIGSSLWQVARSVTQDLQQAAAAALAEDGPEPEMSPAVRRNIAKDKRQADQGSSGWDKIGDLLGFPPAAPVPERSGKAKVRFDRNASPMSPESFAAVVNQAPSTKSLSFEKAKEVLGAADVQRCPKADGKAENIAAAIEKVPSPAKASSGACTRVPSSTLAPCQAQELPVFAGGDEDDQE